MKSKALFVILFAAAVAISGCKKDGLGGKKSIYGTVYYHDGVSAVDDIAPGATIHITYDSKTATGTIDETTTSDAKGEYSFKGLKNGDYFIWGEYTTSHGFTYTTAGYGVTIEPSKDKVSLNVRLY